MRQQGQEPSNQAGHISEEVIRELQSKTYEELSDELFLMGDGKGQEDLMDLYVSLMQEKCPPDDGSFDFDAAMRKVKETIAEQTKPQPTKTQQTEKPHKHTTPFHTLLRTTAIVAATVALTIGCMVGAQASGLDVFGALAQWTGENFHFVSSKKQNPLRDALRLQEIPEELAPTVPEGFVLTNLNTYANDDGAKITASYSNEDIVFWIEIYKFYSPIALEDYTQEKDGDTIEEFISHGRKFFILSNLDSATATWSDGQSLMVSLWGNISADDMRDIISSMGG